MAKFYLTQPVRVVHHCCGDICQICAKEGCEGTVAEIHKPTPLDLLAAAICGIRLGPDDNLYGIAFDGVLYRDSDGDPYDFLEDDLEPIQRIDDSEETETDVELPEEVSA